MSTIRKTVTVLAVAALLVMAVGPTLLVAGPPYSWTHWRMTVKDFAQVGSIATREAKFKVAGSSTGEKTVVIEGYASQTADLLELQDSTGADVLSVSPAGNTTIAGTLGVTGALAPSGALTVGGKLTVNDQALIDGDSDTEVQLTVDGSASQSVDIVQVRASGGTVYVAVNSDGTFDCNTDADFAGPVSFQMGMTPKSVTADPCGISSQFPAGTIFYNGSSGYMCFCSNSNADIKMSDNTTACF